VSFIPLCLGQHFVSLVWLSPLAILSETSHMPTVWAVRASIPTPTPPSLVGWLTAPPMTTPRAILTDITHTPLPRDTANRSHPGTPPLLPAHPSPRLIKPILPPFSLLSLSPFPPFATRTPSPYTIGSLEKTNCVVHSAASDLCFCISIVVRRRLDQEEARPA
jgi:hypothetical protein